MATRKTANFVREKILLADSATREEEKGLLKTIARHTIGSSFVEEDPAVSEWFRGLAPTTTGVAQYVRDLFPSASWARRYNMHWLIGDAIAGVTVGLVVVPQAMAYASLARLPPEYGLYTTFTGACLYWIFGTSKDIVIGTTAVGSLLVGQVISTVEADKPGIYSSQEVAHALSFMAGLVLLFLGFFRLGWLIEFIPYPPINAFVTSASITIISTQLPTCLGIKGVNTRESPYKVYVNTFKNLGSARIDAAIGISSIILLFAIQSFCSKMEARQPAKKRMWSMLSALRLTFTVLLYTFISWAAHRSMPVKRFHFRIVGPIEKGFSHASIPKMDMELWGLVAPELPAIVIILIVEHIAIAKNFGRMYGYTVIPSQEILAQGAANILSPFVGGYACTGSFGASAVLTKARVRTPLAGLFSALVLILALYALTAVFYYIPNAALAGLIIHATWNLVTPPHKLYKFWQFSPFEFGIWVIGVVLAIFTDLETSIYVGIALSFALLLIRMARTPGKPQGQTRVTRIARHCSSLPPEDSDKTKGTLPTSRVSQAGTKEPSTRTIFLPLKANRPHNPRITVEPPYPGVFIYSFAETFNYLNQAQHTSHLLAHIYAHTRRTCTDDGIPAHDRLWSEVPPPPRKSADEEDGDEARTPLLRAVVLDFSTVNVIDVTSVQGLVDMRNELERYAAPARVHFHFAGVRSAWTRRALAAAGFGAPKLGNGGLGGEWCPVYTVASSDIASEKVGGGKHSDLSLVAENRSGTVFGEQVGGRENVLPKSVDVAREERSGWEPVYGVDRPFFHIDLADAVDAAVRDAKKREELNAMASSVVSDSQV